MASAFFSFTEKSEKAAEHEVWPEARLYSLCSWGPVWNQKTEVEQTEISVEQMRDLGQEASLMALHSLREESFHFGVNSAN